MNKAINIECENCETNYTLTYEYGTVFMESKTLVCPFCGEELENIEEIEDETIEEEYNEWDDE